MRRRCLTPLAGAMILLSGGMAAGTSAIGFGTAVHNCQNPDLAPQIRIEACSEAIHTNLGSPAIRARFFYHRAAAYEAAQDFDHAQEDYDKALELKPDFAEAQANRARLQEQNPTNATRPPDNTH